MKKIASAVVACSFVLFSAALAEPITIDLEAMTPAELSSLKNTITEEYERATKISSSDSSLLEKNFKEAFENIIPSGAEASYPFFGLDKQRARTMYMVSGECTAKLADKTKIKYDMTMIYWYSEVETTFYQVAFYSNEKVYYCNSELLPNVTLYLSETILEKLNANEITYHPTIAEVTPVPTQTSIPSPTLEPTNTPPTPTISAMQYDLLQKLFLSLNPDTTAEEFESMVESSGLPFAKSKFNKSSNGEKLSYVVAFTDGAAAFKYAESGDRLEVDFDLGNNSALMLAEYSKMNTAKTALFYQYGTWWDFSDQNAFDYSGYYYVDHMAKGNGITIHYKNGRETTTNYVSCDNGEQALDMSIMIP